jgi:hypothetical protein
MSSKKLLLTTFAFEINYYPKIVFEVLIFLKFKLSIVQTKLDGEMNKTIVEYIDEFYNFDVDNFFIQNHLLYVGHKWLHSHIVILLIERCIYL